MTHTHRHRRGRIPRETRVVPFPPSRPMLHPAAGDALMLARRPLGVAQE